MSRPCVAEAAGPCILGVLVLLASCGGSAVARLPPAPAPSSAPPSSAPSLDVSDADAARCALRDRFDAFASDGPRAERALDASGRSFPEGDVLPLALAVGAYAQSDAAQSDAARSDAAQSDDAEMERVATLIEHLRRRVLRHLGVPALEALDGYQRQGTMLGALALALGHWRTSVGDGRFDALHHRVAELLADALADEMPIGSYPGEVWPIDSVVALRALQLHDAAFDAARAPPLVARFVAWSDGPGTDPATGLPYSRVDTHSPLPPRGSDLAWRILLLAELAPEHARALYARFCDVFWLDRGMFAGFAEWPRGERTVPDVDSGPLFEGVGATASAFGIGTAHAMGDRSRRDRLLRQLPLGRALVESAHGGRIGAIAIDARWVTGFLLGDATLSFSLGALGPARPCPVSRRATGAP